MPNFNLKGKTSLPAGKSELLREAVKSAAPKATSTIASKLGQGVKGTFKGLGKSVAPTATSGTGDRRAKIKELVSKFKSKASGTPKQPRI